MASHARDMEKRSAMYVPANNEVGLSCNHCAFEITKQIIAPSLNVALGAANCCFHHFLMPLENIWAKLPTT